MKFFVIGKRKETIAAENFAKYADEEARMAIDLFKEEFIRELYTLHSDRVCKNTRRFLGVYSNHVSHVRFFFFPNSAITILSYGPSLCV